MSRLRRLDRFLGLGVGRPSALSAYGGAVLAAMAACVLAIGASLFAILVAPDVRPTVGITTTALFLVGVVTSAWRGGVGPGLLCTMVSVLLVDYFFETPIFVLTLTSETVWTNLGWFALATLVTCLGRALLHRGPH